MRKAPSLPRKWSKAESRWLKILRDRLLPKKKRKKKKK